MLEDRPGALAEVATILGENGISIDRMRQLSHQNNQAPVILVTHACERAVLDKALSATQGADAVLSAPIALRIEG